MSNWSTSNQDSCISSITTSKLEEFLSFKLVWEPFSKTGGNLWSADTRYSNGCIAGKLSICLPFVQVYGHTAVTIRDLLIPMVQAMS